jgi:hypothetical protein
MPQKTILASFQRILELFTQKFVTKLSKIWVWDPGSGIWFQEKTYSGSWIQVQGSKRHQIQDPGPGSATLPVSEKNISPVIHTFFLGIR